MIEHQIENLAAAGVTDIVLAVNYRPEIMANALKKVGKTPTSQKLVLIVTVRREIQRSYRILHRN